MVRSRQLRWILLAAGLLTAAAGCESGFDRIDREVMAMMARTSEDLGGDAVPPDDPGRAARAVAIESPASPTDTDLPTVNPAAEQLDFTQRAESLRDTEEVLSRLEGYSRLPDDALRLNLADALRFAMSNSREYQFAEEEYVLACLRQLIEEHRWGPRFFDEVSAEVVHSAANYTYDTSLRLVNELRMTQRLPYGGEVSVRALARATEDLHRFVEGEGTQSAELIIDANIPLLRGSGYVAREELIQSRRNVIYAARSFERFRRSFLFEIAEDFLDLVVSLQRIRNAEASVVSFEQVESREEALYKAGRKTAFEWAEAKNETLEAIDRLNATSESHRLAVERFKVRIGLPVETAVVIDPGSVGLPSPETDMNDAVLKAMAYRLDLQSRRDQVDDARRALDNARNDLLPDLNLTGAVTIPTDEELDRSGFQLDPGDAEYRAGVTLGLPLDREIERLQVRQAEIGLERGIRDFNRFRDNVAIEVRGAVRGIDSARFSLAIQQQNYEIAQQREAAIEADPDRATIQQKTDAINQTARARDSRDSALRDLEVAVLRYLLDTGQLRVDPDGMFRPLAGMELQAIDQSLIGPTGTDEDLGTEADEAIRDQTDSQPPPTDGY